MERNQGLHPQQLPFVNVNDPCDEPFWKGIHPLSGLQLTAFLVDSMSTASRDPKLGPTTT
jgi:hypothetical protein